MVTNKLLLPDTKLEANEKYLFSFETRHFLSDGITSARDSIKIWLSKPGVWGSDLIHTQEIVSGSWVNVEVDLSAYAGQTVTLSLEYTQRPGTPPLIFDCFYLFKKAKSPLALDFVMGNYGYKNVIVQTPVNKKIGFAGANWSNVYGDGYYFCTDATDLNSVFASRIPADSTDVFETDRQYYLCCQFELLDDFETSNFTKSDVNLVDYGTADELFCATPTIRNILTTLSLSSRYSTTVRLFPRVPAQPAPTARLSLPEIA